MNQQTTTTRPMQIALRLTIQAIDQAKFSGPYADKGNKGAHVTEGVGPLDHKLQTTQASKTSKFIKRAEKLKKKQGTVFSHCRSQICVCPAKFLSVNW
jgi:hypothetical protein